MCLVIGAGGGIGGHVGKRFAAGGYHAVLCRRSDQEGLDRLIESAKAAGHEAGGDASGRLIDATEAESLETLVRETEANVGPIRVALYNLGAQIGNRARSDTSY